MKASQVARDIMVPRPTTVAPEMMVFEAMRTLLRKGISGAPVVGEDGTYQGVLSEKACIRALLEEAKCANERGQSFAKQVEARSFMESKLLAFKPEKDALEAVSELLHDRISGAPVVDDQGRLLGVFSERYGMGLVVQSAFERVPSLAVSSLMNTDLGRAILQDTDLLTVARIFLSRYYRRLCVVDANNRVVGLIARNDLLHAADTMLPTSAKESLLESPTVATYMDSTASTVAEDLDLLGLAQIFLHTNYRRLPVLRDGRLVGQISRRDLLAATQALLEEKPRRNSPPLYLSAVRSRSEAPPIE
jgi:CBS domain-containing protein